MKATVNLDEQLYRRVKITAAERGVTVTSIFETALQRYLDNPPGIADDAPHPFQIPIVDGSGGLLPGVDLADGAELERLMDLDRAPGNLR